MKLSFCVACGSTDDLQHHHLVMKSEGGADAETNRITLCTACHHKAHQRQMHGAYSHSALVKAAQARARAMGVRPGRRPFNALYPEATVLACQLRHEKKSLRQIAAELAARGHFTRKGRPINRTTIARMIKGCAPKVPQGRRPWLMADNRE